MAGESVSTRQLSERLGNARADAGLRHPTEALGRRVQGEEEEAAASVGSTASAQRSALPARVVPSPWQPP